MEQEAYRHVPYDVEVEQALLGAILVDNQALERVQASTEIHPDLVYAIDIDNSERIPKCRRR